MNQFFCTTEFYLWLREVALMFLVSCNLIYKSTYQLSVRRKCGQTYFKHFLNVSNLVDSYEYQIKNRLPFVTY